MRMQVRQMKQTDVPKVVAAWNRTLKYDPVTEERFRAVYLEDSNFEPKSTFVSLSRDGDILGFASAVLRRKPAGKDGGGNEHEFGRGYLKAFFTLPGEPAYSTAADLLAAVEAYCREAGKRLMSVTCYGGPYLFPGPDLRYDCILHQLTHHGYRDVRTIEDVGIDLRDPGLEPMLEQYRAKLPEGAKLETWKPSLLPKMQRFVTEGKMPGWFPIGWEADYAEPRKTRLILHTRDEVLGWAQYWPGKPQAGFGPILVLPRLRGRGYGAVLLLESMLRARNQGSEAMHAGWANTGFYTRHGWQITRRYAYLVKELV